MLEACCVCVNVAVYVIPKLCRDPYLTGMLCQSGVEPYCPFCKGGGWGWISCISMNANVSVKKSEKKKNNASLPWYLIGLMSGKGREICRIYILFSVSFSSSISTTWTGWYCPNPMPCNSHKIYHYMIHVHVIKYVYPLYAQWTVWTIVLLYQ